MGRDGVGNAWKVNRTPEVGGSTPLGSTYDPASLAALAPRIFACSSWGVSFTAWSGNRCGRRWRATRSS